MLSKPLRRWILFCQLFGLVGTVWGQSQAFRIAIEPSRVAALGLDQSQRLRVISLRDNGTSYFFRGKVEWQSLTPSLASVSKDGWVKGLGEGDARIKAIAPDLGMEAEFSLSVVAKPFEIYLQAPRNWQKAHIWYWYLQGGADITGRDPTGEPWPAAFSQSLGAWPGPAMEAVEGMPGWFKAKLPRFDNHQEFPDTPLKPQPVRMVFSNPDRGEQTRDMIHGNGCFLAYNRYLGDPSNKVIDGRWDSPNNCPAFFKPLRAVVEAPGGPIYASQATVRIRSQGAENTQLFYNLEGRLAQATDPMASSSQSISIGPAITKQGEVDLCLAALTAENYGHNRCFHFWAGDPSKFKKLGAVYSTNETTFSIWSPDRSSVELWLDGRTIPMGYIGDAVNKPGIWAVTVAGDYKLKPYNFVIDGVTVRDPYGTMVQPGTDFNIVMNTSGIEPEGGWHGSPHLNKREDAIIYEMNIRDFTWDPSSGVNPDHRGRFLGAVESGTHLFKGGFQENPRISTGIDHLKELGITHVQLLPVFDYATCSAKDPQNSDSCYNWGYDPENFNIPEERYSLRPDDYEFRVQEFQTMVNEFHKAGISVVMDVVYNHTWVRPWRETDEGEKVLGDITGQYFLQDEEGFGYQLTGTGNTVDPSRNPMVDQFILDSLIYWIETYHVDGFRFDLAGVFDHQIISRWATALQERFPDKKLLLYGEPWTALDDPNPDHFRLYHMPQMFDRQGRFSHFGGFNFPFREAIKGFNDWGGGGGFAFNQITSSRTIMNGLRGSIGRSNYLASEFAIDPAQTINYVSSHDNLTLYDKISAWAVSQGRFISTGYKARISAFANSIVLMSQGVPFIHSGAELLRSKNGVANSYQAGDLINRIDWRRKAEHWPVFDMYRHVIHNRKRFEGLRLGTEDEINQAVRVYDRGYGLIEVSIRGDGTSRHELLILLNSGPDRDYILPPGLWTAAIEQGISTRDRPVQGVIKAAGTAVTLLYRP
ncbi:alpha-amylase family glycosyl hydrolase [Pseudobacteriovorax antillogorgiicola]|uniref:Pullulanase, type I n=1 Tax=Pseudobacteriovorax antillogorgiicola TaxID=1513793 RepID=A0A1Y6BZE4_9BACT|nr:alpha-amylase family glycosyl hydrolase [Pseudobacteriovorax antillogorgiicola]TCS52445.1 type I pullulanase [Pseudobacteriovorax antillogorgiicola]SMF28584.1 pullulanase, type I [Pseudobacteriovorax antillogorgiicola]